MGTKSLYDTQQVKISTCVCVCAHVCVVRVRVCVCMCVCVRVKSQSQCGFYKLTGYANQALLYRSIYPQCTQVNLHVWASNELVK